MPSPTCIVNTLSTSGGYQASFAEDLIIELADNTGVNAWNLSVIGTDEGQDAATETGNLVYDFIKRRYEYTFPGSAASLVFRSEVNHSKDANGSYDSSLITTFIVSASTLLGYNLIAAGETTERGTFGWSGEINSKIETGITVAEIDTSLIVNDTTTVSTTLTVNENTIHSALWLGTNTYVDVFVYLDDENVVFLGGSGVAAFLPPPIIGRTLHFFDVANQTHSIAPNDGEEVNHGSSLTILPGNSATLISDGTDWFIA